MLKSAGEGVCDKVSLSVVVNEDSLSNEAEDVSLRLEYPFKWAARVYSCAAHPEACCRTVKNSLVKREEAAHPRRGAWGVGRRHN